MEDVTMLYTTWPDAETAHAAAAAAVEARLAACVNILAPLTSVYRWDGRVETACEVPALFKTAAARADDLRALLLSRHPYDLPAMVALPAGPQSHQPYLDWVSTATSDPRA